ncbi:MAG TPA: ChaN family lipoprotein [Polyangiaceae bacterium]
MRRLVALFVSVLGCVACTRGGNPAAPASGATAASARPWTSPLDRDHVLVGKIWDVAGQRFVEEGALDERVARAPLVVVGEQHDNADAHAVEAALLAVLVRAGRSPSLVAEMLDETEQPAIDKALAEHAGDVDGFARAVDWEHSGWPAWSLYRPVFAIAVAARLPIVAAGVERKRTMTLAHEGISALPEALVRQFELDQALPPRMQSELREEMRDTHCDMLPESMLDSMVLVQRLRDATLSAHLALGARAGGALLIAGNGHARSDRGVPALIAAHLGQRVLAVAVLEVRREWSTPAPYAALFGAKVLPFDYVWFIPRASDDDHCAELRAAHGMKPAR